MLGGFTRSLSALVHFTLHKGAAVDSVVYRDDYNALIFNGKKNPSVPKNALLAMGRYGQSAKGDMCNVTT